MITNKTREALGRLRKKIDHSDRRLLSSLRGRFHQVEKIGRLKLSTGLPLLQKARWAEVMEGRLQAATKLGLRPEFIGALFRLIHQEALHLQSELLRQRKNKK